MNELLDIGYHHLAQKVHKVFVEKDCITALGILHRAQTSDSTPLVYDVMELFRADVIDSTVLTLLRQKKRPVTKLSSKQIGQFLYVVNQKMDQHYYLADFKQCQTYSYYMDLQITKFIKAVNHKQVFEPVVLPTRHEDRCTCTPTTSMV